MITVSDLVYVSNNGIFLKGVDNKCKSSSKIQCVEFRTPDARTVCTQNA